MSENLFEIFRSRFPADRSRLFLERPDGSTLGYADVVDLSGRLANVLVELGVKPGDRVAAQVEKSAEALMVYLASLRAGAVYLPLNIAYTTGEIRYFLGVDNAIIARQTFTVGAVSASLSAPGQVAAGAKF